MNEYMAMSLISFSKFVEPLIRSAWNPAVWSCKQHIKCRSFKQFSTKPRPRQNPVIMKLESPQFKAILTPEVTQLAALFDKYGYELRVAGEKVQKLFMKKNPILYGHNLIPPINKSISAFLLKKNHSYQLVHVAFTSYDGSNVDKGHCFVKRNAARLLLIWDLLMGKQPHDLDFATTATPSQMKEMFTKEQIRMINMNGESHGTITPRINTDNFEVTTLRIDVVTDGRRASVEFTKDWQLDALRRDLTINSMFLGFDGTIYDYFHGYEDLLQKRVVFVGNAEDRIREDYLRILRYFRFYGRVSEKPDHHEETVLRAIESNIEGLSRVSGERIWSELQLILAGNFHFELLEKMIECGISPYIGLPDAFSLKHLRDLRERTKGSTHLRAVTILSSLLQTEEDVVKLNARLKMPAFDRDLAFFIIQHREEKLSPKPLLPFQKIVLHTIKNVSSTQKWCVEVLLYQGHHELAKELQTWRVPKFPVSGYDFTPNMIPAKKYKQVIGALKDYWADNNYECSKEEIMAQLPSTLEKLGLSPVNSSSKFK